MGRSRTMSLAAMLAVLFLCLVPWIATGTSATVLTNQGGVATGTLSGLSSLIQLRAPHEVQVIGPMQQFDLPLSSIRQLTMDFPRVIVETSVGVLIAPYSAFLGIAETLTLATGTGGDTFRIPVTTVRAIALHGAAIRPVPRAWMGDRFLSEPEILAAKPLQALLCADCDVPPPTATVRAPVADDSPVIWGTFEPEPVEQQEAFPWWIGLAVAAVLLGAFFLF